MSGNKAFTVLVASLCVVLALATEGEVPTVENIHNTAFLKDLRHQLEEMRNKIAVLINSVDHPAEELAENRRFLPRTFSTFKDELFENAHESLNLLTGRGDEEQADEVEANRRFLPRTISTFKDEMFGKAHENLNSITGNGNGQTKKVSEDEVEAKRRFLPRTFSTFKDEMFEKAHESLKSITGNGDKVSYDEPADEVEAKRRFLPRTFSTFKDEMFEKAHESLNSITGNGDKDVEQGKPTKEDKVSDDEPADKNAAIRRSLPPRTRFG